MDIRTVPIGDVNPAPYNPRKNLKPNDPEYEALRRSIDRWGLVEPLVWNERSGNLVGGHQRLKILKDKKAKEVEVSVVDLDANDEAALNVALNKIEGGWDMKLLADLLSELDANGYDATLTGFDIQELEELLTHEKPDADADIPEPPANPDSVLGEVYELGPHRLMCGDSTNAEHVAKLMGGVTDAPLLHADPPYGMGKEGDGVLNDNLYNDKLDAFQMAWWRVWRGHLADNGSAYIWGNPEGLWRLWWRHLEASQRMTLRNEIVWDKREDNPTMLVSGVPLESRRMYHPTERCLFFMLGEQGFNNNADNYWDGWEGIRSALMADIEAMGWTAADVKRITGVGMYGHWFTKSQWTFIPEEHYNALRDAAREHDAFKREHDAFKREHDELKREHDELKREFYATRAYFDNTHDNMTDVWSFERVTGEDRHGHATPKPVDMCARAIKSSSKAGDVVLEPFGGSGSTLIAAESVGRVCYTMELDPGYCDVIRQRYEAYANG
jgi:DNA modification methylase